MAESKRETIEFIKRTAIREFKDHTLTYEDKSNTWYCGKSGTSIFHFRVAELPSAVFVWGDIGEMAILGRNYNLEWASKSLNSWDYFLSKTTIKKDTYYPGDFKNALLEQIEEYEQYVKDGEEEYENRLNKAIEDYKEAEKYGFDRFAFEHYMSKHPNTELYSTVFSYDPTGFWMIEALKVFFKLYEQQKTSNTQT